MHNCGIENRDRTSILQIKQDYEWRRLISPSHTRGREWSSPGKAEGLRDKTTSEGDYGLKVLALPLSSAVSSSLEARLQWRIACGLIKVSNKGEVQGIKSDVQTMYKKGPNEREIQTWREN